MEGELCVCYHNAQHVDDWYSDGWSYYGGDSEENWKGRDFKGDAVYVHTGGLPCENKSFPPALSGATFNLTNFRSYTRACANLSQVRYISV